MGLKELQAIQAKMEYQRKDEAHADRNYMDLAKFLDAQHLPKYAEKIREIAKDEARHNNILDELLMAIGNEIQVLEAAESQKPTTFTASSQQLRNAWREYTRRVQTGILSGFDKSSWMTVAEDEFKIDHGTASDYWERMDVPPAEPPDDQGPRMVGYKPEVHAPMFEHEIADTERDFPTYDQLKRMIFDLAEGLHELLLPEMKRQYPAFDQPTIEAWSKVTVIEKRDWIYLDTHTARVQVNKETGDVFIGNLGGAGKEMGNIKTLTAEQLFKAI